MSSLTAAAATAADSGLGRAVPAGAEANASRNARAFIYRWGMIWKVPISVFHYRDDDGVDLEVPYISPLSYVKFLLERAPELLFGGLGVVEGQKMLESFWASYQQTHKTHEVFREHPGCTSREIPFCFHGDEGRCLKKTNTCIMMLEAIFGLSTAENIKCKTHYDSCQCCSEMGLDVEAHCKKEAEKYDAVPASAFQEINLQHHSFLTKFVLFALPRVFFKQQNLFELLMRQISGELRQLFFEGVYARGMYWFGAIIGLKGDLAWYAKIGKLTRCYRHVAPDSASCHVCGAGTNDQPFEDIRRNPAWRRSLYTERPWSNDNPPMFDRIPFDRNAPEKILRRDFFHCSKIGTFRDFIGSSLLLIIQFGFFHDDAGLNNRSVLLQRAFGHFRLFCSSQGKHPAMHSFTKDNFNCSTSKRYPWCKTKGSDTMLLIDWLQCLSRSCLMDPGNDEYIFFLQLINRTAQAGTSWAKCLYKHGLWLSRKCALALAEEGYAFLKGYNSLAHACLNSPLIQDLPFRGYGMKPRLHLLFHDIHEIWEWLSDPTITAIPNPLLYGCESNEDVVGRASRLIRRLHQKQVARSALERILVKMKALYRRFSNGEKPELSRKRKRELSARPSEPKKFAKSMAMRKHSVFSGIGRALDGLQDLQDKTSGFGALLDAKSRFH